jgi:hypothetical protein
MVVNIEAIVFFVRRFLLRQMDTNIGQKSNASIFKGGEKNPKYQAKGSTEVVVSHTIRP